MKKILVLAFHLLFLFSFNSTKATHVLGGDCTWKCLGNDTYQITVIFYRKCTDGSVSIGASAPVITSDSCAKSYNVNAGSRQAWIIEDITPVCNQGYKPCTVPNGSGAASTSQMPIGIEKHTLIYKVFLGDTLANCCWYKIKFEQSARSSIITTGYDNQNFYFECWLNRCITCNNGPEFKNAPIFVKCAGQDVVYNNWVYDADGDSISYALTTPLISSGSGSLFTSPWSPTYPVTCYGGDNPNPNSSPPSGFNLNPFTGNILFRPTTAQVSVFKVMVTKWRKDSFGNYRIIGKTARDIQILITSTCPDNAPRLLIPDTYDLCAGQQLCFTISAGDNDAADSTRIFSDFTSRIPAGTYTDFNGTTKNSRANFCWTPTDNDVRQTPYIFIISTTDNHCPWQETTTRCYSLNVKASAKSIRTYKKINCGVYDFLSKPSNNLTGTSNKWFVPVPLSGGGIVLLSATDSTRYTFTQGGTFLIRSTITLNSCTTTYIDTLVVDRFKPINITSSTTKLCFGDTAILTSDQASSYQWYNDTVAITGAISKIYYAKKAGKYSVKNFSPSCTTTSNTIIITESLNPILTRTGSICTGDTVKYKVSGFTGTANYQWYRNASSIPGAVADSCLVTQSGIYFCFVIQGKCTLQSIPDTLTLLPLPAKPVITKTNNTLNSTAATTYQWYYNNALIAGANSMTFTTSVSGSYTVKVTGPNGCSNISDPYILSIGINLNSLDSKTKVSPNPFHNQLTIEVQDSEVPLLISLYTINGKLILQEYSRIKGKTVINTSSLSKGLYFLEIGDGENKVIKKVEKQ